MVQGEISIGCTLPHLSFITEARKPEYWATFCRCQGWNVSRKERKGRGDTWPSSDSFNQPSWTQFGWAIQLEVYLKTIWTSLLSVHCSMCHSFWSVLPRIRDTDLVRECFESHPAGTPINLQTVSDHMSQLLKAKWRLWQLLNNI